MGILSGGGASAAASEILALVEKLKCDNSQNTAVLAILNFVAQKAQEIKEAGDGGWY